VIVRVGSALAYRSIPLQSAYCASQNDVGRELMVAWPTLKAVVGNKVIPGLLDEYLAEKGYSGEQTDEPEDPNRPDKLWEPVPGDRGAHGRLDASAETRSTELALRLNREWLLLAGAGLAGVALGALTGGGRAGDGAPPTSRA